LFGLLLPSLLASGAEFAQEEPAAKTQPLKLEVRGGAAFVGIRQVGEAEKGDLFRVRHDGVLAGYGYVPELVDGWPKLQMLIGLGRHGDTLHRVTPRIPRLLLLTDEPEGREVAELKALCGEQFKLVPIGDTMLRPRTDDLLVAMVHSMEGAVPFLAEDPIVQPHVSAGGTAIVDTFFFNALKQIPQEAMYHNRPPEFQVLAESDLTAGFDEGDRIPWHGKPVRRRLTKEVTIRRGKRTRTKTLSKVVEQYTTRFLRGIPSEDAGDGPRWGDPAAALQGGKAIAADPAVENTAVFQDRRAGCLIVFDLSTLNGRAGRDPGCKNKLHFIACALGAPPRYARYQPQKPDYTTLYTEMEAFADVNRGVVRFKAEGGGSGENLMIHSLTLGAEDKSLVLLVGALEGTDWIASSALYRLAQVLANNPTRDPTIDAIVQQLQIKIIPVLNVHGYQEDKALNAKGVAIDRNFPYHWDAAPDAEHRGSKPVSEPETYILQRLVEEKKAVAFLQVGADGYDGGYRVAFPHRPSKRQDSILKIWRAVLNRRLKHRFVVNGSAPLQLSLTRQEQRPAAVSWAASVGALAAGVTICGDGEDSLANHDVAVEAALGFLKLVALAERYGGGAAERKKPQDSEGQPADKAKK
jgi:hypothetical protein